MTRPQALAKARRRAQSTRTTHLVYSAFWLPDDAETGFEVAPRAEVPAGSYIRHERAYQPQLEGTDVADSRRHAR